MIELNNLEFVGYPLELYEGNVYNISWNSNMMLVASLLSIYCEGQFIENICETTLFSWQCKYTAPLKMSKKYTNCRFQLKACDIDGIFHILRGEQLNVISKKFPIIEFMLTAGLHIILMLLFLLCYFVLIICVLIIKFVKFVWNKKIKIIEHCIV